MNANEVSQEAGGEICRKEKAEPDGNHWELHRSDGLGLVRLKRDVGRGNFSVSSLRVLPSSCKAKATRSWTPSTGERVTVESEGEDEESSREEWVTTAKPSFDPILDKSGMRPLINSQ